MRILSQLIHSSCSINETKYSQTRLYHPVFKGADPIVDTMFVVNDYLEIKDINIPHSYLDEFKDAFAELLENHFATVWSMYLFYMLSPMYLYMRL